MSRVTKTAQVRDSRKKRSDNQNVQSEPYLTPLARLRQYKGIRSKRQKMEDVTVLNGDSHKEVEIMYEKLKPVETNDTEIIYEKLKPVDTNDTEIIHENGCQNGNDINNTEVIVHDDLNVDKIDENDLDCTFESVDMSTDVIEIILHENDEDLKEVIIEKKEEIIKKQEIIKKEEIIEKVEKKLEPVTPELVRKEKYVGYKMSGRRPLRGINSPHPATKRKSEYDDNNDVKRKCEDSPSTSSPGWRYFQSSFLLKCKEAFTPSKNTNLLSPNDSMIVNVDDTSIHNFEDSKFEAELQQPKSNWKVCNIM